MLRGALIVLALLLATTATADAAYLKTDTARWAIGLDALVLQDDPEATVRVGDCRRWSPTAVGCSYVVTSGPLTLDGGSVAYLRRGRVVVGTQDELEIAPRWDSPWGDVL